MAVKVWIWACTPFCLQYRHYMGIYDVVIFADVVNSYDLMLENTVVDEVDHVLLRGRDWYLELVGVQSME